MDRKSRLLISVAVGVLSFFGLIGYLKYERQQLLLESDMVPVVVAKKDMPLYTQIELDMLAVIKVPRKYLGPDALTAVGYAVGQVVSAPIRKGEQILGTKLVTFGSEVGLSSKLAPGYRAVSISVNEVTGVATLVRPNDFIDVLTTFDFGDQTQSQKYTYTLFENVQVLAVNQDLGGDYAALNQGDNKTGVLDKLINATGLSESKATYSLALSPLDAQRLVMAQESGLITVALRPRGETDSKLELEPTTPADLTGIKSLIKQSKPRYLEYRGGTP